MGKPRLHIRVEKIGYVWFTDFSWDGKAWKNLWNGKSEDEAHRRGAEFVLNVRAKLDASKPRQDWETTREYCG